MLKIEKSLKKGHSREKCSKTQPLIANQTRSPRRQGAKTNFKKQQFLEQCSIILGQCLIMLGQCSIMLGQCSIMLGQCSIMLGQCSIMLDQCSIMRAQYSTVRLAQAGEINFSSDLKIFGRLCDSSLISVTDCLFRGILAKFHSISTFPTVSLWKFNIVLIVFCRVWHILPHCQDFFFPLFQAGFCLASVDFGVSSPNVATCCIQFYVVQTSGLSCVCDHIFTHIEHAMSSSALSKSRPAFVVAGL